MEIHDFRCKLVQSESLITVYFYHYVSTIDASFVRFLASHEHRLSRSSCCLLRFPPGAIGEKRLCKKKCLNELAILNHALNPDGQRAYMVI